MTASAFYRNIVIDGVFDDWDGVPVAATDPAGDHGDGPDLAGLQIANNDTHLFLRITYHDEVNPNNLGSGVFIALDSDVNAATGFDIFQMGLLGSEAGWQNDFPFQQSEGAFNSGAVTNGYAWIAPYYTETLSQEYAIPLNAAFVSDGSPVFPQATFRILVYTDDPAQADVMGPVIYTLSPPPDLADSGLSYEETTAAIINPERGFYTPITKPFFLSGNTPVSAALINDRATHFGILHFRFGLEAFSANAGGADTDLTTDMLNALDETLNNVRNSGATAILRFSYNLWGVKDVHGDYLAAEPDMDLIETHIAQLGDVMTPYVDVIACVETGMFGPWGEQHGTPMSKPPTNYFRLVEAWLDAAPLSRTVNVRRPLYYINWANIKYGTNLTVHNLGDHVAAEGSAARRVGVFNDGYLGSHDDLGTFSNRTSEVAWLHNHATHTFYGGEVVADSVTGGIGAYNNMSYLSVEAFTTRTTYLNIEWNYDDVISVWEANTYTGPDPVYSNVATEFQYVDNRLGYRFVLRESLLNGHLQPGDTLTLRGSVENVGFGNVINEKEARIIIRNLDTTYTFPVDTDIRQWSSQTVSDYYYRIQLPPEIEPGAYTVYLGFRDVHEQSPVPSHRAIRFANDDARIWNSALGANFIGRFSVSIVNPNCHIVVDGDLDDWAGLIFFPSDPADVGVSATMDWRELAMAHDETHLYVAFSNEYPLTEEILSHAVLYLDTDSDRTTGYRGVEDSHPIGSDYMIQGNNVFEYAGSGTNWNWTGVGTLSGWAITGHTAECSFPRAWIGDPEEIRLFAYGDNWQMDTGIPVDLMPDDALTGGAYFTYVIPDPWTLDTDGDGLPDGWEYLHFGCYTNAISHAYGACGVRTLLGHYISGTDPSDPFSFFALESVVQGETIEFRIDTVSNRLYAIERALPPDYHHWEVIGTDILGTGGPVTLLHSNSHTRAFYRGRVRLLNN